MPCAVRPATQADVSRIVEFNSLLAQESEGRQLDLRVLRRGVEAMLERPELARYFMAESSAADHNPPRVIGQTMITYEWSDWRAGMFWWIQSVYVVPEARGQGVFRALFRHIEDLAKSLPDVCGLRLYVERENAPALATYGRMGMAPTGHLLYEIDWSGAVQSALQQARSACRGPS